MSFSTISRIAAFIILLFCSPLMAQPAAVPASGSSLVETQQRVIEGISKRVDEIEKKVSADETDDNKLLEVRMRLETLVQEALQSGVAFRPRLSEINGRLEQLGPAPADGATPEPDLVRTERQNLLAEKAEINAVLGLAENLSIRISALIEKIVELRRDLFAKLLTSRYDVNYGLFGDVWAAFHSEGMKLYRVISSWLTFVFNFKLESVIAATLLALIAAAVMLFGGRRLFGRAFEANEDVEDPSYLSRLSVAFWSTLVPSVSLAVFFGVIYFLYDYFAILRGDIGIMLWSLVYVVSIVFFVHRLSVAVLSPKLPNWRLIPVETKPARFLVLLIFATAFFSGLDSFLSTVYRVLGSPLQLTVGEALISTVIIGILVIFIALVKPFSDEEGQPKPWPRLLRYLLFVLGGGTIISALLGYIGLSRFLSQQIVVNGAILTTMYIGFLSARAVSEEGGFASTGFGQWYQRFFNSEESSLDQMGLLASIAINIFIVLVGLPLILLQWGFQFGDMQTWLYKFATGFQIGTFSFSPIGLLSGILIFAVVYFIVRWFQGWLDGSVMARGKVDAGVRNSIRLVVGYAGIALALIMGISAAGLDLSNLALVAGALSLGIGFGLQNIVSNFVSGLILLVERPFKVGDWVVAGAFSGTVRKISVRATEIETFQRQTVILPNSEFINSAVGNWTHRNKIGRVDIKVNIAYDSDIKQAHALLLEIARSHPLVLKNPEPFVLFANFGTAAVEFEVRVFLADINNGGTVQNDIRFAILEAFDEADIDIPSTAREHWRAAKEAEPDTEIYVEQDDPVPEEPAGKRKRKPDPA
ncbi:mechanosensitive ion channel family protein [Mesorhizobium sp. SB112]|uniref:mechanosensitive ion channel family protein n=1 Tax=Mesorhizobium sp. SB112 TaxID=3151853 RepID=UPI0032643D1E